MKRNDAKLGLREAIEGFLFSLEAEGKAEKTIQYYEDLLKYFVEFTKSNGLNDIEVVDSKELRRFLFWVGNRTFEHKAGNGSQLIRKANSTTAWPYYKALRRFFNWMSEEHLLRKANPMSVIHFKAPPNKPIEPFSHEEIRRMINICDLDIKSGSRYTGLRNKAMILLFLDSALRRKEMVELNIGDVDLNNRHVRVKGKGQKVSIVPFSPKVSKSIWMYLVERKRRAKSDRLFLTEEGTDFSINGINSWFLRLKKRSGIYGPGGVHRLRHTSALEYLRGAKDSFLLQLFLRHESLEMSRRYTQGLKQEEAVIAHRNGASPVKSMGLS